jgi:hypothetical protein
MHGNATKSLNNRDGRKDIFGNELHCVDDLQGRLSGTG